MKVNTALHRGKQVEYRVHPFLPRPLTSYFSFLGSFLRALTAARRRVYSNHSGASFCAQQPCLGTQHVVSDFDIFLAPFVLFVRTLHVRLW